MIPQIENVNPAGVNRDGYLADISGGVWPPSGMLVAIALIAIASANASILPTQSTVVLFIRYVIRCCSEAQINRAAQGVANLTACPV